MKVRNFARLIGKRGPYNWYQWVLFVDEPDEVLSKIERVEYRLDPSFPNPIRTIDSASSKFALHSSGWGEFEIGVTIHRRDGSTERLVHHLKLKDDWPSSPVDSQLNPKADKIEELSTSQKYFTMCIWEIMPTAATPAESSERYQSGRAMFLDVAGRIVSEYGADFVPAVGNVFAAQFYRAAGEKQDEDAVDAVAAALEIHRLFRAIFADLTKKNELDLRCGIHSGIIADSMDPQSKQRTSLLPTVYTSIAIARSVRTGVYVSDRVARRIKGKFQLGPAEAADPTLTYFEVLSGRT